MRSVCICFSGFLETQEHSFICNCHPQLIIAWYVLYINSVTFYICSLEHRLSFDANSPMGNISKRTLVCLFGPKNCPFLCKGDVHRHQEPACVCMHTSPQCSLSETHSTNRRRASQWFSYCSQTLQHWCVYPGSCEKKEDGGHTGRYVSACRRTLEQRQVLVAECRCLLLKVPAAGAVV